MNEETEDYKKVWIEEARREALQANPLIGYCERVYFVSRSKGIRNGKRRKREKEIELLRFLPSGRCVVMKDIKTKDIDALADEIFHNTQETDKTKAQMFLDFFRQL